MAGDKENPSAAKGLSPLQAANIKRGTIKGQLTKFKTFLFVKKGTTLTNVDIAEIQLKLNKFVALESKFDELQTEIELLNYENLDYETTQRESIEEEFVSTLAMAKTMVDKFNDTVRQSHSFEPQCSHSHQDHQLGIKLPQIQIAKFDGSYFRWLEFRDTFKNLIHDSEKLSDIQKFYYLNSYLEGEALRIVSNLEISSTNYVNAWELLNNRYNNSRVLIDQHLNSLCNIQPMTRESEKALRFLIDHVTKNLRALESLGLPTRHWDAILIFLLAKKLDPQTLIKWEELRSGHDDNPSLDDFKEFLASRADVLQALSRNKVLNQSQLSASRDHSLSRPVSGDNFNKISKRFSLASTEQSNQYKCIICKDSHRIYDCPVFKAKALPDRMADVHKHKLCMNCLRSGHSVKNCMMGPCRECKKRHNSLLHPLSDSTSSNVSTNTEHEPNQTANFTQQIVTSVLLSTAIINVTNPTTKQSIKVRALLDSGSQSSFVSQSLRQQLSLQTNKIDTIRIFGIGNSSSHGVEETSVVQISSLNRSYHVTLSCLVLEELTGELPRAPIDISQLQLPNDIQLADPNFDQPAPIDVLIGADLFWDILRGEKRSLGPNNPKLQNSLLGWLIAGPISNPKSKVQRSTETFHSIQCNHAAMKTELTVDEFLPKFWELEELPKRPILSEDDKFCEAHFLAHTVRLSTGRFCVKLPLKDSPDCLGESYYSAKRRFLSTEKRFRKNPTLKSEYVQFINEYADLRHLSESPILKPDPSYFLCHHAVFKQESESTKTRVVFDGSNPTSSGYSLNDILMTGPNVQDSLFSILVRARQYKYILCGDIEKMYRQIEVDSSDRNLQLILWRQDESQPIRTLQLNTLTYGTASASYLSTRCLWQVGEECQDDTIKTIIQRDFYVDDLITGSNSEQQLRHIKKSISTELSSACFNLRKFKSNLPTIFESTDVDIQEKLTISESSNTLGLGWNPSSDTFHFPIKLPSENKPITKRFIMSNSFRIFDPLGLLSPCIIQPKMLLQDLWSQKLDWDQPVPQDIKSLWLEFSENLTYISSLEIPRRVICDDPITIELHSFSDASQRAYGACVYIRSIDKDNQVNVQLLCAKSKVASLKPVTIPRLELCAALLAARLCNSVMNSIRYQPARTYHWCDSSIVLGWLKANPTKLKTFVANRVVEINELTELSSWRYVPTDCNSADLISRGVNARQLRDLDLWWSGPSFLLQDESKWPDLKVKHENLPEIKNLQTTTKLNKIKKLPECMLPECNQNNVQTFTSNIIVSESIINFEKYSTLLKLQRSFAYVQRFIFNLKNPKEKRVGILTCSELNDSFSYLCSVAQKQSFPSEFESLMKGVQLKPKSRILSLSPFLKDNLIRVGGRIAASTYTYEKKHPILLDSAHHLTKLIFEREHISSLHAGPQLLLATVREYVWPINGRRLARRTVHNCVRCRRFQAKCVAPKMGDLPNQRITPDFPFISVGLDFAGPFQILNRKGRGAKLIKCYLCIFVCLRYKCVHLEAVSDLSKDAFIMTLRRFVSRRGKPAEIFCDNGRNFVATARELADFLKQNNEGLSECAAQQNINFKFIPAYAPHFGGIWEAGVKSAKYHLKRVMGYSHLTLEEISTLFAQVEAVLNSRPLCPLSNSPDDFLFLSPGHFLVGRPLTALPAPPLEDRKESSLTRYTRLEKIRQTFWNTWQKLYISELQQRKKWKSAAINSQLKIGDLVLIQEDCVPPLNWRLGRVLRLYPGPDGISRVADINTTRGCIRRPLRRLCPLHPAEEN